MMPSQWLRALGALLACKGSHMGDAVTVMAITKWTIGTDEDELLIAVSDGIGVEAVEVDPVETVLVEVGDPVGRRAFPYLFSS
jgi:hypothetical protein